MSKQTRKDRKNRKKIWIYITAMICAIAFYIATEKLENKTEKNNINEIINNRNNLKYTRRNIYIKKYTNIYRASSC